MGIGGIAAVAIVVVSTNRQEPAVVPALSEAARTSATCCRAF